MTATTLFWVASEMKRGRRLWHHHAVFRYDLTADSASTVTANLWRWIPARTLLAVVCVAVARYLEGIGPDPPSAWFACGPVGGFSCRTWDGGPEDFMYTCRPLTRRVGPGHAMLSGDGVRDPLRGYTILGI
ncbi:hypothetical protein OPV22_028195 [Ensete ventricosum]|uniref:Uncharacterized protein n=1 Tax=Ensete ventricosum TaxID=4639 RepID=A0AAV8Q5Q4_ENSVE|nr:hypothetical protein OPV22_028195 [Ensete ventricosum]RWW20222.1 hypothetical protein GW17_00015684 [Ensete ventricosum]RZS17665.1 hypothetical protein BHM03_00049838 [Ensete ventricosum]